MLLQASKMDKAEIVMIDGKDDVPTNDIEKTAQVRIIDSIPVLGLNEDDAAFYNSITQDQRTKIIRKVSKGSQMRLCCKE
jgi:NAD kinase